MNSVSSAWLAVRTTIWTLLFPGVIAGYVPWRFFGLDRIAVDLANPRHLAGCAGVGIGSALLVWCVWEFGRRGRGTLSPVDPPRALVVRGPYRVVRNPMYLGVTMVLLGEVLLTRSGPLLLYWAAWFLAVNLFILGYEEPTLRQRFGRSYDRYVKTVGRWIPRVPWREGAVDDASAGREE